MPIFDLEGWTPERTSQALNKVWAIMTYPQKPDPQKPDLREEHLAVELALRFADGRLSIHESLDELTPTFFRQLLRPLKERTRYSYWKGRSHAMQSGLIAGQVLMLIKQIEDANYVGSVNKAIFLLEQEAKSKHATTTMPQTQARLRAAWGSYTSVAHLWAAYHLFSARVIPQWRDLHSPDGFRLFLACAKFWWRFGIRHIADRTHSPTRTPVLLAEETWRVPDDFPLPTVDVPIPALSDKQRETLKSYSSPK